MGKGYLENPEGVTDEWILDAEYENAWQGELRPAEVHLKSPCDPKGLRAKT